MLDLSGSLGEEATSRNGNGASGKVESGPAATGSAPVASPSPGVGSPGGIPSILPTPSPTPATPASPSGAPPAILAYPLGVDVAPSSARLYAAEGGAEPDAAYPTSRDFTAVVHWNVASATQSVTWAVSGPPLGTIDAAGRFQTSSAAGTTAVRATATHGGISTSGTGTVEIVRQGCVVADVSQVPTDAQRVDIRASGQDGYSAEQSVLRSDDSIAFRLETIPAGSLTVLAEARASDGRLVATGSARVTVRSGGRNPVSVPLSKMIPPEERLAITAMSPLAGAAGSQVLLSGRNFGATAGLPYVVTVGGRLLGASQLFRTTDSSLYFGIPAEATRSIVLLSVDGQTVQAPSLVTRLTGLSIAPAGATLSPGATASFSVRGVGVDGSTWDDLVVTWSAAEGQANVDSHDHGSGDAHKAPALAITAGGMLTVSSSAMPGAYHVMARQGVLLATASISVQ